MDIEVNIKVRNPEWYETDQGKLRSKAERELMPTDVPKHSYSVKFKMVEKTERYQQKADQSYTMRFLAPDQVGLENPVFQSVVLKDVDVTEFIHGSRSTWVVVSNELIHNTIADQNSGGGKHYWYYYLHGDADYFELERNIWLSRSHVEQILKEVPFFSLEHHIRSRK